MYIIINNTLKTKTKIEGSFPSTLVEEMLENDNDLIIISHYSNTIKIPFINKDYHSYSTKSGYEWDFKDYNF
jgi:hypothetical protein